MRLLLLIGLLLISKPSQSTTLDIFTSRVGGGSVSNLAEGFTADAPRNLPDSTILANGNIQLRGASVQPSSSGGLLKQVSLNIYILKNEYQEASAIEERTNFVNYFLSRGWSRRVSQNPCVETFEFRNSSAITVVVGWGAGHGIALTGARSATIEDSATTILDSLQLTQPNCEWL